MTKNVANTLTRWHKISERVRIASKKVQEEILCTMNHGHHMDADTFSVMKNRFVTETKNALSQKRKLHNAMVATLFDIRKAVAMANVTNGVSDLLNQIERYKQERAFLEAMIESQKGHTTMADYEALAIKKAKPGVTSYHVHSGSVSFVAESQMAELVAEFTSLGIKLNELTDKLSDANATKLTIAIDDAVAAEIGM